MTQPGRRSAASLDSPKVTRIHPRPEPSPGLSEAEGCEWIAIVNRMPHDHFPRETHPLLECLCRAIVAERGIAERLRQPGLSLRDENLLHVMLERERRAITSLSRAMRLTQHSRYAKDRKLPPMGPKPWE